MSKDGINSKDFLIGTLIGGNYRRDNGVVSGA